jgi:hypothetical protein
MAVSAVDAVEVTDAKHCWTEVARDIVEFVKSQHRKSYRRRDKRNADPSLRSG